MSVDNIPVRLPLQSTNVIPSYLPELNTKHPAGFPHNGNLSLRQLPVPASRVDRAWMQENPLPYGLAPRNVPNSLSATSVVGSDLNGSASAASWFRTPTMFNNRSSLVTLPDRGKPVNWGSLDCSWLLPDEPKRRPPAAAPGDRTPKPSPTRATRAPQTRPMAPDLRLASAALLTQHKGAPAPAAPKDKSNHNAANAALAALWPLPNMPRAAKRDKENVAPKRDGRGRSPTPRKLDISVVPNLRPKRRRGVRGTAPSSFALTATDSPGSSPSPSLERGRTTPGAGLRTGRPATRKGVRDADVSPLRLPDSVVGPSFSAASTPAAPAAPAGIAAEASLAAGNIDTLDLSADADMYDADDEGGDDC